MDIRKHYSEEMVSLNNSILKMALIVKDTMHSAVKALQTEDYVLAEKIIRGDRVIDNMELDLCDRCAVLIATEQPVATDLRVIVGALRIVSDLERMGDLAAHIAKGTLRLRDSLPVKPIVDIPRMADIANTMVEEAVMAFIHQDVELARKAAFRDDEIDTIYNNVFEELADLMVENREMSRQSTILLFMARSIERYADHAENICEWVVYTGTGVHEEL